MTLEEAKDLLRSVKIGDAGVGITFKDVMTLDIPGIPDFEHDRRAKWLAQQLLPARFSITPSSTGSYSFQRIA